MKNKCYTAEARDREIAAIGRSLLHLKTTEEEASMVQWLSAIDLAPHDGSRATTARHVICAMVESLSETDRTDLMSHGLMVVLSWLYYRKGGRK